MAGRHKPESEQARQFALTLPVILGIFAAIFWFGFWKFPEKPKLAVGLLVAAPAVCLVAVALPGLWLRFFKLWMTLAEGLGWFMTRVILSVFYYLIMSPIGLIMRLIGKRPLDLAWKDGKTSYWKEKAAVEFTLERYRKQF